jgi:hypothetical protein
MLVLLPRQEPLQAARHPGDETRSRFVVSRAVSGYSDVLRDHVRARTRMKERVALAEQRRRFQVRWATCGRCGQALVGRSEEEAQQARDAHY